MPQKTRLVTHLLPMLLLLVSAVPCHAWIYDGGAATGNGPMLQNSSSWVAARFILDKDAYGTIFGSALTRSIYIPGGGFDVYLTTALSNDMSSAIAHWTLIPTSVSMNYYYAEAESPIFLQAKKEYDLIISPNCDGFGGAVSYTYKSGTCYGFGTTDSGQTWSQLALPLSVRVDGWYVPEPGSLCALMIGLMSMVGLKRRHRKSID